MIAVHFPLTPAMRRVLAALEALRGLMIASRRSSFASATTGLGVDGDLPLLPRPGRPQRTGLSRSGADGWSVVDRPSIHFRRPQGLLPLPMPSRDGSIDPLRSYVNRTDSDFRLLIAWLATGLRPIGPYPILALYGEQGSAKSTLARITRLLIDPQDAALLAEPRSTRDLMVTAVNGWLVSFDNISVVPAWLSDSLCRLASGGSFATRLLSNDERSVINAQRPVILNGIEDFVRRGDLADRGVFLHLPPIGPARRRNEREFWASFQHDHPRIFGGVLDLVVGGLPGLPLNRSEGVTALADFAAFGEAVGRGMGWPAGSFLSAYNDNRRDATMATLEDSLVAEALVALCGTVVTQWSGTPTELHSVLTQIVGRKIPPRPAGQNRSRCSETRFAALPLNSAFTDYPSNSIRHAQAATSPSRRSRVPISQAHT